MTAVLVFQQIEAGHLALSDTIERWFPELPDANTVTIDHLLTHRSGYVVPAQGPLPLKALLRPCLKLDQVFALDKDGCTQTWATNCWVAS